LIPWRGWADQHISLCYTIAYHEAMQNIMAQSSLAWMRLLPRTWFPTWTTVAAATA
jgi:hypothetical protein